MSKRQVSAADRGWKGAGRRVTPTMALGSSHGMVPMTAPLTRWGVGKWGGAKRRQSWWEEREARPGSAVATFLALAAAAMAVSIAEQEWQGRGIPACPQGTEPHPGQGSLPPGATSLRRDALVAKVSSNFETDDEDDDDAVFHTSKVSIYHDG